MNQVKDCVMCDGTHDNRMTSCPPRMDDGRHFTDYRPRCVSNFIANDDALNSFEYRQYLINNADKIMKNNSVAAYKTNSCGPCVEPYDIGTMLPEQTIQVCNKSTCKFVLNDQDGLGLGRDIVYSEESKRIQNNFNKNKENEQLYFKKSQNCCMNQSETQSLFPYDGFVMEKYVRSAVPSGAPLYSYAPGASDYASK